jgi:hypothetical protein
LAPPAPHLVKVCGVHTVVAEVSDAVVVEVRLEGRKREGRGKGGDGRGRGGVGGANKKEQSLGNSTIPLAKTAGRRLCGLLKRNGEEQCNAPNLVSIKHGGTVVTGGAHPVSVGVRLVGVPVQGGQETAGGAELSVVGLGV